MNLISIITLLLVFCLSAEGNYRLPTNVKPSFYTLRFHPNLDTRTFKGHVSIQIKVKSFADFIAFHSRDLNITSLFLNTKRVHDDLNHDNSTFFYKSENYDLIKIRAKDGQPIAPGSYKIHIEYSGFFSKTDHGFTLATYSSNGTVQSHVATTDFEPIHARSAFPCFDEPAFKAKFQLTLIAPNSTYIPLSNMRTIKNFTTSYGHVYKFETTPRMSTYLLAFALTQHQYVEQICGHVPIKAFSYNELDPNVTDYVCKALQFYTTYTDQHYVLPKIDLIEYDRESSTATENWGLITARAGVLRNTDDVFVDAQKVNIITHELAHFWFGNLVTNEWWDDIWLQEGFAVFMALKAEDLILKNDAIKNFPSIVLTEYIFPYDIKNKSKPIVNYAQTPSRIIDNFSDTTYNKGAALLLMLEKILGEYTMQQAIRCYIKRYAFKTATTNDLISVLEDYAPHNIDLRGFMESYLYQNTYPVIQVTERENDYILTQFSCSVISNNVESPYGYKWTIPINYKTSSMKNTSLTWFFKEAESLTIPKNDDLWIVFNPTGVGFYRVNYSESLWERFINNAETMDSDYKSNLFIEAFELFITDVISCDVALDYFRKLTEKNNNTLSIDVSVAISAMFKSKVINYYDEKAYRCLKGYISHVCKNSGYNVLDSVLEDDLEQPDVDNNEVKKKKVLLKPTDNMKSCTSWILNTFPDYCD